MTEINRRSVAKGLAWSVPAVALAGAAPAFAASSGPGPDPEPPVVPARISTAGWTITASSSTDLSSNQRGGRPQHAFDNNEETFWHSQWEPTHVRPPHWIQALSPVPVSVSQVRIMHRQDSERYRTATVQVSDDGLVWTNAAAGTHSVAGTGGPNVWYTFEFPAVSTRFIRLTMGADGTYEFVQHWVLREVQFWG